MHDRVCASDGAVRATIDAQGLLLSPPFVDAHLHLDATPSCGPPRVNRSGTLLEGIALWGQLEPALTFETRRGPAPMPRGGCSGTRRLRCCCHGLVRGLRRDARRPVAAAAMARS